MLSMFVVSAWCIFVLNIPFVQARYKDQEYALGQTKSGYTDAGNEDILKAEYENLTDAEQFAKAFKNCLHADGIQFQSKLYVCPSQWI